MQDAVMTCNSFATAACATFGGVLTNVAIIALVIVVLFLVSVALIILRRMLEGQADTRPVALVITFGKISNQEERVR